MNRYQLGIPPEEKFVLNGKSRKAKKKAAKKTAQTVPVPEIIVTRDELLLTEAYKLMREEEKRTGKPSSIDKFWDIAVAKHKPTAKELIAECQMFWEVYCKKPLKANLLQVADHCEAMKASKAKSVKAERQRCMRSVRTEAKERGWKL